MTKTQNFARLKKKILAEQYENCLGFEMNSLNWLLQSKEEAIGRFDVFRAPSQNYFVNLHVGCYIRGCYQKRYLWKCGVYQKQLLDVWMRSAFWRWQSCSRDYSLKHSLSAFQMTLKLTDAGLHGQPLSFQA